MNWTISKWWTRARGGGKMKFSPFILSRPDINVLQSLKCPTCEPNLSPRPPDQNTPREVHNNIMVLFQLQADCWRVLCSVSVKHILKEANQKKKKRKKGRVLQAALNIRCSGASQSRWGSCRSARHKLTHTWFWVFSRHLSTRGRGAGEGGGKKNWHQPLPLNNGVRTRDMIEAQLSFKGKHPFHSARLNKFHFSQRVIIPLSPPWKLFSFWAASFLFYPAHISLIIDSCICVYLA